MFRPAVKALAFLLAAILIVPTGALAVQADGKYRIEVDVANQITTVYRTEDGSIARQMICSTGANDSTPRGTFHLQVSRPTDRKEWYFIGKYQCYVKYPTRIKGAYLFHSLPYEAKDLDSVDAEAEARLGSKASHGCVRLRWEDAQWIAENCPDGTETRIFTGAVNQSALRELLLRRSYRGRINYERFIAALSEEAHRTMRRGDSGEDVEALQRKLGELGCFSGKVSGEYDSATVVAISRYQTARGMAATGLATPALVERIMTEDAG